jgi:hypothetical protein
MLMNRGRGYQNLRYLLLKAKRMAATNVEFIAVRTSRKQPEMTHLSDSHAVPIFQHAIDDIFRA